MNNDSVAERYVLACDRRGIVEVTEFFHALKDAREDRCDLNSSTLGRSMKEEDLECVAGLFEEGSHIRDLDIGGHGLPCSAGAHVARMLENSEALEKINISSNDLRDEGIGAIARILHNSKLRVLNASSTGLGIQSLGQLMHSFELGAPTFLAELSLEGNSIECEGARIIANGLLVARSLRSLSLRFNSIGNKGANCLWTAMFQVASNATSGGNNYGLCSLDLSSNLIKDDGVEALLNEGGISSVHCTVLPLQRLSLRSNGLTDDSAANIAELLVDGSGSLSNLSQFYLGANLNMTEGALISFARAIPRASALARLDLQNICLSELGASELARAIQLNPTLMQLVVDGTILLSGAEQLEGISDALTSNTNFEELTLGQLDKGIAEGQQLEAKRWLEKISNTLKMNRRMHGVLSNHSAKGKALLSLDEAIDAGEPALLPAPTGFVQAQTGGSNENPINPFANMLGDTLGAPWTPLKTTVTGFDVGTFDANRAESDGWGVAKGVNDPFAIDSPSAPATNNTITLSPPPSGSSPSTATMKRPGPSVERPPATSDPDTSITGMDDIREKLNSLRVQFDAFQPDSTTDKHDEAETRFRLAEQLSEQIKQELCEEFMGKMVAKVDWEDALESLHQELEQDIASKATSQQSLEERIAKLEEESRIAKEEREQAALIVGALSKKIDQAIILLKDTIAISENSSGNVNNEEVQKFVAVAKELEEFKGVREDIRNEFVAYEASRRSEMGVFENHLSVVSHRLRVLEQTVVSEQESNLNTLEAIMRASRENSPAKRDTPVRRSTPSQRNSPAARSTRMSSSRRKRTTGRF